MSGFITHLNEQVDSPLLIHEFKGTMPGIFCNTKPFPFINYE